LLNEIDPNNSVAIASAEAGTPILLIMNFVRNWRARVAEAIALLETRPVIEDCKAVRRVFLAARMSKERLAVVAKVADKRFWRC
jgi:hypothetical protein